MMEDLIKEESKPLVPVCEKYTLTIREAAAYFKEDFAFSKLRERYKKWTGNSFDEKDLISFGLANEQGYLTNAGALVKRKSALIYFSKYVRPPEGYFFLEAIPKEVFGLHPVKGVWYLAYE